MTEQINNQAPNEGEEPVQANTVPTPSPKGIQDLGPFLDSLAQSYEELELPSRGLLYDGKLPGGKIHIRAMTMKEEKFLATPRLVRSGKALDMIFEACASESFSAKDLLSIDRTFLLIWLRGISYGPEYDVNIKCQSCGNSFPETVNLSDLPVEMAPLELSEPLSGVFPKCGHPFRYRLSRGEDEADLSKYRERRAKEWGDQAFDDTLLRRDTMLVEDIAGFTGKTEISAILESLTMDDISYLRELLRNPGFGVDTSLPLVCPFCSEEFSVELPMDANFFFPRRTRKGS